MARVVMILLGVCAVASARLAYQFSNGADTILQTRSFAETFSCDGLPYGYYADDENACEIFHICFPVNDDAGALIETAHFSFICPNQTIFSQDSLICKLSEEALPCSEARGLYEASNAQFGVVSFENQN